MKIFEREISCPSNFRDAEIKVPSGTTSGLKINPQGPIEIADDTVHVTLMIDLEKSFVFTGSGQIHLKPVIKATVGGEAAGAGRQGGPGDGVRPDWRRRCPLLLLLASATSLSLRIWR